MQQFDDIWFTYKARIAAEVRLRNNDLHSQVLLIWYAVLSTAGSIVAIRHEKFLGPDTDISMAVLSVGLLAISMLVASRDFKGRALMMRANHLALKTLFDELKAGTVPATEKPPRYAKLLHAVLYRIDNTVRQLFDRFKIAVPPNPKRAVKAYFEAKRTDKTSHRYIPNYDSLTAPAVRTFLTEIGVSVAGLPDDEVMIAFNRVIGRATHNLQKDVSGMS
jgi:hypothetical protein